MTWQRARTFWQSLDPRVVRRLTVAAFCVLSVLTVAVAFWIFRPDRWRYYTDGISIRRLGQEAVLRYVLWEDPEPIPGQINNLPDNKAAAISADGRTMIFVRGAAGKNADLYVSHWDGRSWDVPKPIEGLNTKFNELDPEFSNDGKLLYFSSNRPGGAGGYDLWAAHWNGMMWTDPVNLGPNINSPADELGPALTPAGDQLYFSSNRPKEDTGKTDWDIFVAAISNEVSVEPAHRVDALNSEFDDGPVALTPRGDFFYFSSNRPGGAGGLDIYRSRFMDGELMSPENLGAPVNSAADETDPRLWMEGYSLVFSTNKGSGNPREFSIYRSVSREVIARNDLSALAQILQLLKQLKWLVLLLLVALMALLYLMRSFLDKEWQVRASLLQKCLMASVGLHLLLAFLLSLWMISSAIYEKARQPVMEVAIKEDALAQEKLSLSIREQVTKLRPVPVPSPVQEQIERMPVPEVQPLKQTVQPETAQTKVETFAVDSLPPTEIVQEKKPLQPVEHTRELPATREAAVQVHLEQPQPLAAQPAKDAAPAPSTIDVKPQPAPVRADAPAPVAASMSAPADVQKTPQHSALARELPVQESATPAALTAQAQKPSEAVAKLQVSNKVTMENQKVVRSEGAGPQVKPLQTDQSLASATEMSAPKTQPQKTEQAVSSTSTPEKSQQQSALARELPVAESKPAVALTAQAQKPSEAVAKLEVSSPVAMEVQKPVKSTGAGPQVKPLESDRSLASATDLATPQSKPREAPSEFPSSAAAAQPQQRSALERELPVSESKATAEISAAQQQSSAAKETATPQLTAQLNMESEQPVKSQSAGPDINPMQSAQPVTSAADLPVPQRQPQKAGQESASAAPASRQEQRSALERELPVLESQQAGAQLAAHETVATNSTESLELASTITMEAERAGQSAADVPDIKPLEFDPSVAAVAQLTAQHSRPQKVAVTFVAAEVPKVNQPSSGPVRPMEAPPNLTETMGPGRAPQLKIPALEVASAVKFEGQSKVASTYMLRDPKQRGRILEALGGTPETEAAIVRALDWFTRHQETDGRWSIRKYGGQQGHDVGATALALLCYMGWGAKHNEPGPYQGPLSSGIDWLLTQMRSQSGDIRGEGGNMYDQGMGTMALAEAYGLTRDAKLLEPLKRGVAFILAAQNQETGGWRYIPGEEGDTSVFGWQVMALKSARLSGLQIPPETLQRASRWLDRIGGGEQGGLYGYQDKAPRPAMAAEGMFCRQLLGAAPSEPKMNETAGYLKTFLPKDNNINFYYWYYGCLSLYQHQGPVWEEWNQRIREILVSSQKRDGDDSGSWEPRGEWANPSGRVIVTAMATLSLEVYYRYLPLYGISRASE